MSLRFIIVVTIFCFLPISQRGYAGCGPFSDNGDYCEDVKELYEKKMINGYESGEFGFGDILSRREMMKMTVLSLKDKGKTEAEYKNEIYDKDGDIINCFPDVYKSDWAYEYICYAKKEGIVVGYPSGEFHPIDKITYDEASKIILKTLSGGKECWKSNTSDWWIHYVSYMNEIIGSDIIKSKEVERELFAHMLKKSMDIIDDIQNCSKSVEPVLPTPESPSVVVMDLKNEPLRQVFWKKVPNSSVYRIWRKNPEAASATKIYCGNGDIVENKYSYIDNDSYLKKGVNYEYSIQAGNSESSCSDPYEDYRHWSHHSNPTILHSNVKKLILVDGLHPWRTAGCIHTNQVCRATAWDNYLGAQYNRTRVYLIDQLFHNNQNISNFRELKGYDIYAFRWSGDVISGKPDIPFLDLDVEKEDKGSEDLKEKFNDWMNNYVINVSPKKPTVSFLAYSWGTVITTDFIASLPDDKININILLTIGCPVTGANINFLKEPFWKVAGDKLKDKYQAKWINIVKDDDVVAWDIEHKDWKSSPVDNFVSVGANSNSFFCQKSKKGRLPELFPVSESAMEMKYLKTAIVKGGFYGGIGFGQLMFLQLLVNTGNLDDYVEKTGDNLSVSSIEDIGESIFEHHLICPHGGDKCGYHPDQLIKFIRNKWYCQ
ncbi:MAG: S-layer homology domain-containing protein [Candidatus Electrothrix sp. LOE2]|nr:S-layer homology domain-containing protein [Candidatus Electrothrix sp. LOE2]